MTTTSAKNMFSVLSVFSLAVVFSMGTFAIAHADLGYIDTYGNNIGYIDTYGSGTGLGYVDTYGDNLGYLDTYDLGYVDTYGGNLGYIDTYGDNLGYVDTYGNYDLGYVDTYGDNLGYVDTYGTNLGYVDTYGSYTSYTPAHSYASAPAYASAPVGVSYPVKVKAPTYYSAPVGVSKSSTYTAPFLTIQPIGYSATVATSNTNIDTVSNSYNTYDYSINDSFNTYDSYNTTNVNTVPVYTAPPQYYASATAVLPPTYTYPTYYPRYVTLSQLPYTGFDVGPIGNTVYWVALALFALAAAYLAVYYLPRLSFGKAGIPALFRVKTMVPKRVMEAPILFARSLAASTVRKMPTREFHAVSSVKDTMSFASLNGAPRIVITRS